MRREGKDGGFLAVEVAVLAFLLLAVAASFFVLERSVSLFARSEAETGAMFLAQEELAWAEREARLSGRPGRLPAGRSHGASENGTEFSVKTEFERKGADFPQLCRVRTRVDWQEKGKAQAFSLERTVRLGE